MLRFFDIEILHGKRKMFQGVKSAIYQILASLLTHQAAEGDDRGDAGEVEEDDGGEALRVQAVADVTFVLLIATLHIRDHTAEYSARQVASATFNSACFYARSTPFSALTLLRGRREGHRLFFPFSSCFSNQRKFPFGSLWRTQPNLEDGPWR